MHPPPHQCLPVFSFRIAIASSLLILGVESTAMRTVAYSTILFIVLLAGCGGHPAPSAPDAAEGNSMAEDLVSPDGVGIRDAVIAHLEAHGDRSGLKDSGGDGDDSWSLLVSSDAVLPFGVLDVPSCQVRILDSNGAAVATAQSGESVKTLRLARGRYKVEVANQGTATVMAQVGYHKCSPWDPRCEQDGFYASIARSPWPKAHANLQNTGLGVASSASGQLKWSFSNSQIYSNQPAIGPDGTIYLYAVGVAPDVTVLEAFAPDGSLKWTVSTPGTGTTPAVGSDGTIYLWGEYSPFTAFNPNGTQKWNFPYGGGSLNGSPAIAPDGTIYFGSVDRNLYALNPNGSKKWSVNLGGSTESSPALGTDGTIYIGCDDDNLYAVSPAGSVKWTFHTNDRIGGSPSIGKDGTIYVLSDDSHLYAVTPEGAEKWTVSSIGTSESGPSIGPEGNIYVQTAQSGLVCISSTGSVLWSNPELAGPGSPAISSDGTIFAGSTNNSAYSLTPSGSIRWSYNAGNSQAINSLVLGPAIGSDGTVYFPVQKEGSGVSILAFK